MLSLLFFVEGGAKKEGGGLPKQVNIKTTALTVQNLQHRKDSEGYKLRYKLYTNVSDFTGNRTVPSMDNSNAARVPSPTVLYRIL